MSMPISVTLRYPQKTALFPGEYYTSHSRGDSSQVYRTHVLFGDQTHASGTHTTFDSRTFSDAPYSHTVPPGHLFGKCNVLDFPEHARKLSLMDIPDELSDTRVIIKTAHSNSSARKRFAPEYIRPDFLNALFDMGVRFIGVDAPLSLYEPGIHKSAYKILQDKGMTVCEGLDLSTTPEGDYFLNIVPKKYCDDCFLAEVVLVPLAPTEEEG